MPEQEFKRDPQRMNCSGVDLNRPVDSVKDGRFSVLLNMRSYQAGRLEPRTGLTLIGTPSAGQAPLHSARRLNDNITNQSVRVIGSGSHLAIGLSSFTDIDSGYSGNPLALVPYRPDQSSEAWMYVADSIRMKKVLASGTLQSVGLPPPNTPPTTALAEPTELILDNFNYASDMALQAVWSESGFVAAPTRLQWRANTTITQILYDKSTTGWASVQPAALTNILPGSRVRVNSGGGADETATVHDIHQGSVGSITIASILYDSGTTGFCSVVLSVPVTQVEIDTLLQDSTVGSAGSVGAFARVRAIVTGPDGTISLRFSTSVQWSVGDTVLAVPSFRSYFVNNHADSEAVQIDAMTLTTAGGGAVIATVTAISIAQNLSIINGRALQQSDYIHVSGFFSNPAALVEVKIMLDVDAAGAPSGTEFTQNFYYYAVQPNYLTPSVNSTLTLLTTQQTINQNAIIEAPTTGGDTIEVTNPVDPLGPPLIETTPTQTNPTPGTPAALSASGQTGTGASQWTEIVFRVSDLIRVGTDDSRSLANLCAIRIQVSSTDTCVVDIGDIQVSGTFGPDAQPSSSAAGGYIYRHRARCSTTGAASNFGPPTRGAIYPDDEEVIVSVQQYTAAAEADVLDFERYGGEIAVWHYVGTCPNSATPSFDDVYADDIVANNPQPDMGPDGLDNGSHYQPWPVIDIPRSGTTGIVSGSSVADSATSFNLAWAPGTDIQVNGIDYTLYRVITTSQLEIIENAGSQTAVTWKIAEPTILGQPLPCLWGPDADYLYACGDPLNPGRLYRTNTGDPDSTLEGAYIDITDPSEPLMNGIVWNGRNYVWSSERMFQIFNDPSTPNGFRYQEIPNGKGLFSRWFLSRIPGPLPFFGSKDGIYVMAGGSPTSITSADLYPLFPHEGNLGVPINGIYPPNVVAAQAANLRLDYADGMLYNDYPDTNATQRSLAYNADVSSGIAGIQIGSGAGWWPDQYTPGIVFHYEEEGAGVHSILCGGQDGNLYQLAGTSDAGTAIECVFNTPAKDQGDARSQKIYNDCMLDADCAGVSVTVNAAFLVQSGTATGPSTVVSTSGRLQSLVDTGNPSQTGRAISLEVAFSFNGNRPLFYQWEARYAIDMGPIVADTWESDYTTHDIDAFKVWGDVWQIGHISTANLSLICTIDGVAQPSLSIPNGSGSYVATQFRVPTYKGKGVKYRLSSPAPFQLYPRDSYVKLKPWGQDVPFVPIYPFGGGA